MANSWGVRILTGPLAMPLELLAGFWRMFLVLLMERRFPKGSTPFHPAVFGNR